MSNWPDGTVQTQSGCTIPAGAPLCGDCGNGFRFPPGQARTQQAGLTDFCGAAAPQHRRGAPVSRVWGRHSPTSFPRGAKPQNCGFWHRGRNLLSVTANFLSLPSATFSENRNQKNSFLLCLLLVHQEPVLASCFSFSATNNPAKDIPARFR